MFILVPRGHVTDIIDGERDNVRRKSVVLVTSQIVSAMSTQLQEEFGEKALS